MSNIIVEHSKIYKSYFNAPYIIADSSTGGNKASKSGSADNIGFIEKYRGIDVMTPVTLCTASKDLYIPCVTIGCSRHNTIIRTAVAEREGTVKELFSAGDWVITLKGILTGDKGQFPKEETECLIEMSKNTESLELWCGLTDMFMPGNNKVVVESLELPEIKGGGIRHRPFSMTLESDYVDSLIIERV